MRRVHVGYDHAGHDLATALIDALDDTYDVRDAGPGEHRPGDDYPSIAFPVAERVAGAEDARGVLVCGSGQGMAMAANRVPDVRAAHYDGEGAYERPVSRAREHNDANVLALSGALAPEDALDAVVTFLETEFSGDERHRRRIDRMDRYPDRSG